VRDSKTFDSFMECNHEYKTEEVERRILEAFQRRNEHRRMSRGREIFQQKNICDYRNCKFRNSRRSLKSRLSATFKIYLFFMPFSLSKSSVFM